MKNSAWYHKLWLTKLNDLPLKENADAAWTGMEQMLDQQLPVDSTSAGTPGPKPTGTSLGTYLGYIVSAAAMVGATAYITLHSPDQEKVTKVVKDKNIVQIAADTLRTDSISTDSSNTDSLGASTLSFENIVAARVDSMLADRRKTFITDIKTSTPIKKAPLINTTQYEVAIKNNESDNLITKSADPVSTTSLGSETDIADSTKRADIATPKKASNQLPNRELPADISNNAKSATMTQKRPKRSAKVKTPINTPPYNFGLEAGVNHANDETTFHIGAFGTYALSQRWLISTGLRLNTPRSFTGNYTRESYFRPDSLPVFSFTDNRKVLAMDIPITITYKLSNTISLNAGPAIGLPLKQSGIKLGPINQPTDTLRHTNVVYSILNSTKMNRINLGFSTGISLHLPRFDINARYQVLSPYRFSNEFGDNKFKYLIFQFGIGYRFKQ